MQPVHLRRRKLRQQFSEFLAQGKIWLHLFVGLGVEIRKINGVANFTGEQIRSNAFGDFDAAFFLRLLRAGAEMRRECNRWMFAEGMVWSERFASKDVESRRRYFA